MFERETAKQKKTACTQIADGVFGEWRRFSMFSNFNFLICHFQQQLQHIYELPFEISRSIQLHWIAVISNQNQMLHTSGIDSEWIDKTSQKIDDKPIIKLLQISKFWICIRIHYPTEILPYVKKESWEWTKNNSSIIERQPI